MEQKEFCKTLLEFISDDLQKVIFSAIVEDLQGVLMKSSRSLKDILEFFYEGLLEVFHKNFFSMKIFLGVFYGDLLDAFYKSSMKAY